ncbi:YopX family protein [Dysgonomonas capnocytophagoides]|uniref:YopX family protein n=1 Tax=Dysgonomonas capnocytophagoides TaxID=45254 RepID=UPI00333FAB66
MREIEFRGKRKDGVWVFGDYFDTRHSEFCNYMPTIIENGGAEPSDFHLVDPETVSEFTGVKIYDINGGFDLKGNFAKWDEVFEHDILRVTDKKQSSLYADISYPMSKVNIGDLFFVKWFESGFQLVPLTKVNQKNICFSECPQISNYMFSNCHQSFEIVGNIFDTPELLNPK